MSYGNGVPSRRNGRCEGPGPAAWGVDLRTGKEARCSWAEQMMGRKGVPSAVGVHEAGPGGPPRHSGPEQRNDWPAMYFQSPSGFPVSQSVSERMNETVLFLVDCSVPGIELGIGERSCVAPDDTSGGPSGQPPSRLSPSREATFCGPCWCLLHSAII